MKIFAPTVLGTAVLFGAFAVPAQASSGRASFYGAGFAGKKTASGERFNPSGFTCAHRSLPFGTRLKLTNTANGRTVVVRVNDRGPFVGGRIIDVSQGAAQALGFVAAGTARLQIEHVSGNQTTPPPKAPAARATTSTVESEAATPAQSSEPDDNIAAERLEERRNKA
jgi:rare lipoprotein A